jgi:hypothetical protein
MTTNTLTQERLKELLTYDPETGVFVWVTRPSKSIKVGDVAGSFRPDGYRQIQIDGAQFRAHRLAWLYMTGTFPPDQIDHIDRNPTNNQFTNLRAVTGSENQHNSGKPKDNTSGYRGVSYDKRDKKWRASIRLNNVLKNLGYFPTPEEASVAYLAAQRIYHPTCPTI